MELREAADVDVLCFATQGPGSGDHQRLAHLLAPLRPRFVPVDRARKSRLPLTVLREIRRQRPAIVVLEGTGAAGGFAALCGRVLMGVPYVVSSGDAVSPFLRAFHPRVGLAAAVYERALYRMCAGFIGWSPYLVGRALHLGAPRGMTAAHFSLGRPELGARERMREQLGIPPEAIVIGIAGRILIDARQGYSYGHELIRALHRTHRSDLRVLIVGDGDGLPVLTSLAGDELGKRVLLTGGVSPETVPDYLAAMDIGALSQSTDLVGGLRYTTKLPEYLAAGLPVVTGEVPAGYDLDTGWLWRLPGDAPWTEEHIDALAQLMETVTKDAIAAKQARVPSDIDIFDSELQQHRVCAFVRETARRAGRRPMP